MNYIVPMSKSVLMIRAVKTTKYLLWGSMTNSQATKVTNSWVMWNPNEALQRFCIAGDLLRVSLSICVLFFFLKRRRISNWKPQDWRVNLATEDHNVFFLLVSYRRFRWFLNNLEDLFNNYICWGQGWYYFPIIFAAANV